MTVGEFFALMDRDREAAWTALRSALMTGCSSACAYARLDPAQAEDLAHDGVARITAGEFLALRDTGRSVPLSAWSTGVAKNLVRERLRVRSPRSLAVDPPAFANEDGLGTGWDGLDLTSLTDAQADAIRARLKGQSERDAAAMLAISRTAFRDRTQRAIRQLKRTHRQLPPLPEMSRAWAETLLAARPRVLKPRDRRCLLLYAEGKARREIGLKIGLSVNGVKCLLRSLKRRCAATPGRAPTGRGRTRGRSRGSGARSTT